ncbi:MAG: hypothetical protein AAGA28_12815 [Pseudomonadota bacterium]
MTEPAADFPLTVSLDALIEDGSDQVMRAYLQNLTALASEIQALRRRFSAMLGITSPHYLVLMHVARHHRGARCAEDVGRGGMGLCLRCPVRVCAVLQR